MSVECRPIAWAPQCWFTTVCSGRAVPSISLLTGRTVGTCIVVAHQPVHSRTFGSCLWCVFWLPLCNPSYSRSRSPSPEQEHSTTVEDMSIEEWQQVLLQSPTLREIPKPFAKSRVFVCPESGSGNTVDTADVEQDVLPTSLTFLHS